MTLLALILLLAHAPTARAERGYPNTREALRWKPDRGWLRGAFCVHRHESVNWHLAGRDWAGNASPYYGGLQFLISTWQRPGVDGKGVPSDWAPREQLYRAWRVWKQDGGSWHEWGTASACGLA